MSDHTCEWRDAIIDACVVDWILTAEHEHDPRKAVNDLLCWQQQLALDPAVSEPAAKLHARIAELEAALASIGALVPKWRKEADESGDVPLIRVTLELCADDLATLCHEQKDQRQ